MTGIGGTIAFLGYILILALAYFGGFSFMPINLFLFGASSLAPLLSLMPRSGWIFAKGGKGKEFGILLIEKIALILLNANFAYVGASRICRSRNWIYPGYYIAAILDTEASN